MIIYDFKFWLYMTIYFWLYMIIYDYIGLFMIIYDYNNEYILWLFYDYIWLYDSIKWSYFMIIHCAYILWFLMIGPG